MGKEIHSWRNFLLRCTFYDTKSIEIEKFIESVFVTLSRLFLVRRIPSIPTNESISIYVEKTQRLRETKNARSFADVVTGDSTMGG